MSSATVDSLMGQFDAVSLGIASRLSSLVHGEQVTDYSSGAYQQAMAATTVVYAAVTLGAGAVANEVANGVRGIVGAVSGAARGSMTVYRSLNAAGDVQYVGITNNLARRAAEHLRGSGIQIEKLMGGLSRTDARAVEQALIEVHGLGRNGGTLLNRINSIARSNPAYADQLRRGYELLQTVGY
jgi:hypothetical protein